MVEDEEVEGRSQQLDQHYAQAQSAEETVYFKAHEWEESESSP